MREDKYKRKIKPILEASYLNQDDAKKKLQDMGYTYDNDLSTNESKVFVNKKGIPHIAFRGSKRIFDDWLGSDLSLALGKEKNNRRFQEARNLTELVEKKYGKPANTYGDSLGGSLSEKSGANGKIFTHNKGVGMFDIGKAIPKNQVDYRNQNDIVSFLSKTQNYHNNNLNEIHTGKSALDVFGNHSII